MTTLCKSPFSNPDILQIVEMFKKQLANVFSLGRTISHGHFGKSSRGFGIKGQGKDFNLFAQLPGRQLYHI